MSLGDDITGTVSLQATCFLLPCGALRRCCTIKLAKQMGRRGVATPSLFFYLHAERAGDYAGCSLHNREASMKAVVMAGGEGSRLRPLTIRRPKPMVPIAGKPVMEHILQLLKRHGITEVIVTVQYL